MGFNQLKRDINKIRSRLNTEVKVLDNQISFAAIDDATPGGVLANGIAQGLDKDDRVGRVIRAKSLQFVMTLNKHASATATQVRVILFKDVEGSNGASFDDIYNSTDMISMRNTDSTHRFKVYYNRVITLNDNYPEKTIRFYKPLSTKVKYNTTTAVASAIETNSFRMMVLSDEATNQPSAAGALRFRWVDN
jgi:hypothetical protein